MRRVCGVGALSDPSLMRRVCFAGVTAVFAQFSGQTVIPSDGSIARVKRNRTGRNSGSNDSWANGRILKDPIGAVQSGSGPLTKRQLWAPKTAGWTTTFTPNQWDGVPKNG